MNKLLKRTITSALLFTMLSSCKKESSNEPAPESVKSLPMGDVEVVFEPMFEDQNFKFRTDYVTLANDTININELKYFVSNIGLSKMDASEVKAMPYPNDSVQCGVYLVDFAKLNSKTAEELTGFKFRFKAEQGDYADIRFEVCVPRELNLAEISKNPYPLNSNQGMYWSWNSGFKYLVVNGQYNDKGIKKPMHLSLGVDKKLMFNFRSLLLASSRPKIEVREGKICSIKFKFDVGQIFVNTDGSAYKLKTEQIVPDALNPAQVHGGHYANVIRANAQQCLELIDFKTN